MFFCSVEMLPDWAICKEDTLQFCLICNGRGAYLWRGTFPCNTANHKQELVAVPNSFSPGCLYSRLREGSESSNPCPNHAPSLWILSSETLPQTCSCLLPLWQQAFLMVTLRVLLELFIHLSGSSIWVARRQGALLVSLEVFWGFLGRHWMSGLPWKVMFSTLHLWAFLRTPVQNPLGWRTKWWEQLRICLYGPTHSSVKRKMKQAVKNCLLKHLFFISLVSPALPG